MRHELAWLSAAGWAQAAAQSPSAAQLAGAPDPTGAWRLHDWPVVLRRREPGQDAGRVALGLPLPPGGGDGAPLRKLRFGFSVDAGAIARTSAPLPLAAAALAAPPAWRAPLAALLADGAGLPPLRVFGSLAMQALTGLAYVRDGSDIDVLAQPGSRSELAALVRLLQRHAAHLPLDGEIVFPGAAGDAVAWREWADGPADARVLVKSAHGVRLSTRSLLLEQLA